MAFLRNAVAVGLFAAVAIGGGDAHAIVATVANGLSEKHDGGVLEVTNIKGKGVPPNLRVLVMPGEKKQVTRRNVYSFVVNRVYSDRKERFQVLCPEDPRLKEEVTMNFKEIESDQIPGGCVVAKRGRWTADEGAIWVKKRAKIPFIP